MTMSMLTSWWSVMYLVPFGLALVYLGVFVLTGVTFGDAGVDAHVEVDAGADLDGDAGVDADAHADADADHDAEAEQDGDGHWSSAFLGLLGAGKVPLSLGVMMLLLLWGLIGFGVSVAVAEHVRALWLAPAISLPAALLGSVCGTWLLASAVGRVMGGESAPARRQDLVGRPAEAVYDITESFGMAAVRSAGGDLLQVPCKARSGEKIAKGSRVVLFAYDKQAGIFSAALME